MWKHELILLLVLANICQINQVSTYIPLLAKRGVLVQLGLVLEPHQVRGKPSFPAKSTGISLLMRFLVFANLSSFH